MYDASGSRARTAATRLCFDASVPITRIVVEGPEIEDVADEDLIQIDERITHQLAQRPASYHVIEYVRRVVKRRGTSEISCPPAPTSVLEKSYAEVSLLAGMLVDKLRYHIPLYRQHQRLQAAGITLSRASLTAWVQRTSQLLAPIYQVQLGSVLGSDVLAMDETPIRAGRKAKGKMRTAYFWPIYPAEEVEPVRVARALDRSEHRWSATASGWTTRRRSRIPGSRRRLTPPSRGFRCTRSTRPGSV